MSQLNTMWKSKIIIAVKKEYTDMFAYTEGCVVALTSIFKDNVLVIAGLAFSVCFLEICCLVFSSIISKHIVCKTSLKSSNNDTSVWKSNSRSTPAHSHRYYR